MGYWQSIERWNRLTYQFGARTATLSPGFTPASLSAQARLSTRCAYTLYVYCTPFPAVLTWWFPCPTNLDINPDWAEAEAARKSTPCLTAAPPSGCTTASLFPQMSAARRRKESGFKGVRLTASEPVEVELDVPEEEGLGVAVDAERG